MKTFLIHGSYGYTGQLIAELAVREGLKPILAGRAISRLQTRAGYSFAAQTTVEIMKRILSCDYKAAERPDSKPGLRAIRWRKTDRRIDEIYR